MKRPIDLRPGQVLVHKPEGLPARRIRFEEDMGGRVLRFTDLEDAEAGPYMVPGANGADAKVMPTYDWALAEMGLGRLVDPHGVDPGDPRVARFAGMDASACGKRDPRSIRRHAWGLLALKSGLPRSQTPLTDWLKTATGPLPKPSWRSVIRYMDKLAPVRDGVDPALLVHRFVNRSGRLPGQSQLSDLEDRLVHHWATRYWESGSRISSIDDAAALMVCDWFELEEDGVAGVGHAPPSGQALRDRVHSLRCRATVAAREGEHEAERLYGAVREPVPVEHCMELVMIDGVQFRHAVQFAPDWDVPVPQMKSVAAMSAKSQYVWRQPVFCGPFRPEMAARALRNVLVCDLTEEEIAADPRLVALHQPPSNLYFDNDRAILPPGMVPHLTTVVSSLETGAPYSPDEKGKLENYFKYLKHGLRRMPGLILGPRRRSDPRRDPIADASVDRLQYAAAVENLRRRWNASPKISLGNRSPEQIMLAELA